MDCNHIKKLLEKYWEGESSIAEEQELKNYFNGDNIADELKEFQPLFAYLKKEKELTSKQDFSNLEKTSTGTEKALPFLFILKWMAAAASIIFLMTMGLNYYKNSTIETKEDPKLIADTYKNPDQAYQEAKAALLLISKTLNKGMDKGKEGIVKVKN